MYDLFCNETVFGAFLAGLHDALFVSIQAIVACRQL